MPDPQPEPDRLLVQARLSTRATAAVKAEPADLWKEISQRTHLIGQALRYDGLGMLLEKSRHMFRRNRFNTRGHCASFVICRLPGRAPARAADKSP